MPFDDEVAAVDREPSTLLFARPDQTDDPLLGRTGHDRAHLTVRVTAGQTGPSWPFADGRSDGVGGGATVTAAESHAPLPARSRTRRPPSGRTRSRDQRRAATIAWSLPSEGLDSVNVRGSPLVDVLGDRVDPTKELRRRPGVWSKNRFHCHLVAVDDVEHAIGRPASVHSSAMMSTRWIALARFDTKVLPHGRGIGCITSHPEWEVERRDARDDAQRLAERVDVDSGRDLVGILTLSRAGFRCVLDNFQPALHLPLRVGHDLAVSSAITSAMSRLRR